MQVAGIVKCARIFEGPAASFAEILISSFYTLNVGVHCDKQLGSVHRQTYPRSLGFARSTALQDKLCGFLSLC